MITILAFVFGVIFGFIMFAIISAGKMSDYEFRISELEDKISKLTKNT